ncbi:MAG: hypothetical protein AAFQ53_14930, partial [Bacteroidota bacterium]
AAHPGQVAVTVTPVIGRGMKLFGSLATAGIRGQVNGEEERARTVPIYVDKKPFRKSLCIKDESEVYAYLVERDTGTILWIGDGAIDMDELRSLERAIEVALPRLAASGNTPLTEEEPREPAPSPAFDGPGDLAPEASGDDESDA